MWRLWPFFLVALLLAGAAVRDRLTHWVETTQLPSLIADTSMEVHDRNGRLLRAYTVADGLWRMGAPLDAVDSTYVDLLIAFEDKRFWEHGGVDPKAMLRAAAQAATSGRILSGGSTLSMQVARLIEDSGTGSWQGKLRQIRVALALEARLGKREILELYLTHAPFGGNVEGIRAASFAWFGKPARRLTHAEAALLVALPQSPNARRPDRHPEAAAAARERVLRRGLRTGVLDADAFQAAMLAPVPKIRRAFPKLSPHLADRARARNPDQIRHQLTLDRQLQAALEKLAQQTLQGMGDRLSIAVLVADHQSGDILASVGSAAFDSGDLRAGYVDMTQAKRSPGSTLKPLIYGLSFDQGLAHPNTVIRDAPVRFGTYAPRNFDGLFRGDITVSEALRLSLNIPVVLLTHEIGPANLMAALRRAGTAPKLPGNKAGLAVALGGVGLSLQDLVQLYAGLANEGRSRALHWHSASASNESQTLMSRSAAWHIGNILSDIPPPSGGRPGELAHKTGTSYGHRDAWAIGYDGKHVAGVWIGRPDGTPVPGAFGAEVAVPVLFDVFQRIKPALDPLPAPPPETILLDTAQLPEPLRKFRGRDAIFEAPEAAVRLAFPPDGARLMQPSEGLVVKLDKGALPITILANGKPLKTGQQRRDIAIPLLQKGASTLTVIDADGQSDRVTIWIE